MKRILLSVLAIAALIAMIACGGGGSSSTTTAPSASSAPVTINIGDAPVDRLLSFEVTVTSFTMTGPSGTTGNLATPNSKIELTHLSGKFEPLSLKSVTPGSYTSATLTLADAEAVIGDSVTGAPTKVAVANAAGAKNITFSPALNLTSTPQILNFDVHLDLLLTITGNSISLNSNATNAITLAMNAPAQAENEQENEDGEIEDIHGVIQGTPANNSFTILLPNASTLTFATDANTEFSDGLTSFASLAPNMVVKVEGRTRADGTLLAKEVEGVQAEPREADEEGIITATTGSPVRSFQIVVREVSSSQSAVPATGDTITVNLDPAAAFRVDLGNGKRKFDKNTLPAFDAAHLGKGQSVEADDDDATVAAAIKKVALKKQALVGSSVSGLNGGTFTLAFDQDSFFTTLTGESTITVVTTQNTITKGAAVANGAGRLRVRGLLFFDPLAAPGAKYTLFAERVDHP
jgi:hypothetical protein